MLGERGLFGVRWKEGMLRTWKVIMMRCGGYPTYTEDWSIHLGKTVKSDEIRSITCENRQPKILRDENIPLGNFSLLFYQNLLRMVDLINFHLFLPTLFTECSFILHIS